MHQKQAMCFVVVGRATGALGVAESEGWGAGGAAAAEAHSGTLAPALLVGSLCVDHAEETNASVIIHRVQC
jgi:hypothetical protein